MAINDFNRWGSLSLSVGIHLLALTFLPVLFADLSLKNLRDEKPPVIRFVEIVNQSKVTPEKPVPEKTVELEHRLPEPEAAPKIVNNPAPQTASVVANPVNITRQIQKMTAHATAPTKETPNIDQPTVTVQDPLHQIAYMPTITASPKSFPEKSIDTSATDSNPSSLRQLSQNVSQEPPFNKLKPRTVNESFKGFTSKKASPLFAGKISSHESFLAKPLTPKDEDVSAIEDLFASMIREKIAAAKTYPQSALIAGHEGRALVAFTITQNGQLLHLSLEGVSGYESLDEAAMQAVKKASPYPPIPEKLRRNSITFKLPISFKLR